MAKCKKRISALIPQIDYASITHKHNIKRDCGKECVYMYVCVCDHVRLRACYIKPI